MNTILKEMEERMRCVEFYIPVRSIPIHYYPIEFQIMLHSHYILKDYSDYKLKIYNPCCYVCKGNNRLEMHHIIEVMNLGNNKRRNLLVLCYNYHKAIHNDKDFNPIIPVPKNLNSKLLKKKRKLLLKLYKQDNTYYSDKLLPEEFIKKHIDIDDGIKYLIKKGLLDRLKEFKKENNILTHLKGNINNKNNERI